MSSGTKLKVFRAVVSGLSISHKNPPLFIVSAVSSAIISIFMYFTTAFYQPGEEPELIYSITGILSLGEYLLFALTIGITTILTYAILSKMAFDSIGSKPELSEAIFLSIRKFLPLLGMYILYVLIVMFGSILLFLPGIFLFVKLFYCPYFILFENKGVIESFRSSWQMVKGNWWRTLALLILWGIFSSLSAFVVYLPRTTETIIYFVIYLLLLPWSTSSYVHAYTQLKGNTVLELSTAES